MMIFFTIARPRPMLFLPVLVDTYGSKMRGASSAGTGTPSFDNERFRFVRCRTSCAISKRIRRPEFASMPLRTMFEST